MRRFSSILALPIRNDKGYKMKKITFILAALLMLTSMSGCGSDTNGASSGLVTTDETTDPNATRIDVPSDSDTDSVNVRDDDTAVTGSVTDNDTTAPTVNNPDETRITFLAAGDNIIHANVYTDAMNRATGGEKYNFIDMYDGIADMVEGADIALINQESPICGEELTISGYPNFNSPDEVGDTLIELGFDIVNIANNHMLDKLERGYKNTLEYWKERENDILMIGGYNSREDYENIRIIEEQGVSIAFISYTYSTNGQQLPASSELYIPYISESEIVRMTKKADELADLVFVVMHWGGENENSFTPSSSQYSQAQALADAGADVIIGMHPHVIQGMDWCTAADGSDTLVVYSLGNLLSTQLNNRNLVGGIVTFDIVKDKNGDITIENPIYNPTVTHYNTDRLGLQVYLMENYTAELAALHGTPYHAQSSSLGVWTLDKIRSFATDNVKEEFLHDFLK